MKEQPLKNKYEIFWFYSSSLYGKTNNGNEVMTSEEVV